jgi:hypothetical protein
MFYTANRTKHRPKQKVKRKKEKNLRNQCFFYLEGNHASNSSIATITSATSVAAAGIALLSRFDAEATTHKTHQQHEAPY